VAWTYDVTKFTDGTAGTYPTSTLGLRYQIRLLLQDNQSNRPLLQDEEIDWLQTQEMNAYMAAARCCDMLIARAGSIRMKRVSELVLEYDPKFYQSLAFQLRARGMTYQMPFAGGISISDKLAQQSDIDAVVPLFFRGFADNPYTRHPAPGEQPSAAINNPNAI
jgi:hypothetical protein